jgi:phosphoribosylformylglycinamidine cyclo-ligase
VLGAERVRPGDVLVAMASSGAHSNGYSLLRHVFFDVAGWELDRDVPEFGRTLGAELLEPTRIYSLDCLALIAATEVHAFSHITGGGVAANIARIIPAGLAARLDRATWTPPAVFETVGALGGVATLELEKTLNMGVGMVAVLPAESVDPALRLLAERGLPSWLCGEVVAAEAGSTTVGGAKGGDGAAALHGEYAK